jgi:hypothetical protein
MLRNPSESKDDTALKLFLELLERSIDTHPERLQGMPEDLRAASGGHGRLHVTADDPIDGPVAL